MIDDFIAFNFRINRWHIARSQGYGFGEEAHEAQADPMLLFKQIFVGRPCFHHRGHVDIVERRQQGGGVLRGLQALGDSLAQTCHFHAFFLTSAGCLRR